MSTRLGLWLVALVVLFGVNETLAADDPAPADAETAAALKIMQRRIGTWEDEITIKPGKLVPPGAKIKSVTVVKWDLGGRFIRGESAGTREQNGQQQKTSAAWMMTWNKPKRQFNSWFFFTVSGPNNIDYWGGPQAASVVEWDERSQTLRMESADPESGVTGSGSWHYIDDDRLEFGFITRDKDGNVMMEQTGKSTRRKEK